MTESKLPPRAAEPEQNLLGQIRTWTDIFPWLRLARVLRVAGGPIWIAHVFLTMLIWLAGIAVASDGLTVGDLGEALQKPQRWLYGLLVLATSPGDAFASPMPAKLPLMFGREWAAIAWTSFLWLPTSMIFIRAGALLTSGREMPSYLSTLRLVLQRLWAGAVILLLPLVCALPFLILIWGITASLNWLGSVAGEPLSKTTPLLSAAIVMPAGIIAGLLLATGKAAVPLGLANLMTMAEADPMDSLSRGYEYTLRRLPQLLGYSMIALLLGSIAFVGWAAIGLTSLRAMTAAGQDLPECVAIVSLLLASIPVMLAWSMFGGVYLLLRQSAGGQETEDIWAEPDAIIAPALPSVERKSSVS